MMNFNYETRFQDIISEVINNKQNKSEKSFIKQ